MRITQLTRLYFACLLGILSVSAFAQPYAISKDGAEVTDKKTGLIWRRCAEGMKWTGKTCAGEAGAFSHVAALQLAKDLTASTGLTWRLPIRDELTSIVDRDRTNPAINLKIFPGTPAKPFWVDSPIHVWPNSPSASDSMYGWFVDFNDGYLYQRFDSNNSYLVRLVRTGQ